MSKLLELVSGPLRFAVIAALIPFFANFTIIRNGVYRDYVAIVAGGLALLLALISISSLGTSDNKTSRLGITIATVLVAAFHIARGFGLFA